MRVSHIDAVFAAIQSCIATDKYIGQKIEKLLKQELIEVENGAIKLSKKGIDLANLVWEEFI